MASVSLDEEIESFEASASTVFAPLRIRPLREGPFRSSAAGHLRG